MVKRLTDYFKEKVDEATASEQGLIYLLITIIAFIGSIIFFFGGIYTLLEGLGFVSVIGLFLSSAFLIGMFFVVRKTKRAENGAFVTMIVINCVAIPYTYFTAGGAYSGMLAWMVMTGVALAFLLRGWRFYLCLVLSFTANILCLWISYFHEDWVGGKLEGEAMFIDMTFSLISSVICLCLCMATQKYLYYKQREKNRKQQEALENALSTQSRFLANISHEIRTPINTIIGLNEMTLREQSLSEDITENSINIQNASRTLLSLINDILDLSRIESGQMEIIEERYETAEMLSDIVNSNWVRAKEKDLDFRVDIDENLPSMLFGDDVRVKQIVTNLVTNAVKYTQEGHVTLAVSGVSKEPDSFMLKFVIEDTGVGIKRDDLSKLFSSFSRVDEQKNKGIEGTGLGLSIVSQLLKLMNGTVTVDSIYGKGSTFTAMIPQGVMSDTTVGKIDIKSRVHDQRKTTYKQSFEAPEAKVLVVDDNSMNLLVAGKLLRATKVRLDTASSGADALKLTEEKTYDVILMDHIMPEMDGVETLRKIRTQRNGFNRETPVIAMTANAMSGAADQYVHLGFSDYIAKPVNSVLLEATLLRYLPSRLIEYRNIPEEDTPVGKLFSVASAQKKQKVVITTDSICDLPDEVLSGMDIPIVRYYVVTDDGRFKDGAEIFQDNLTSYMVINPDRKVFSDPPDVNEYESFFSDILARAENIIHISMSAQVSKGYENALTAAKSFSTVTVIDSHQLSSGMGLIVMRAAKLAMDNAEVGDIVADLKGMRDKVSTSFIVDDPEFLHINGRMSKQVYELSKALKLHPVLSLKKGKMGAGTIFAGDITMCYQKYIKKALRHVSDIDRTTAFLTHVNCGEDERALIKNELEKYISFEKIYEVRASAAISGNAGPGAMGILFARK